MVALHQFAVGHRWLTDVVIVLTAASLIVGAAAFDIAAYRSGEGLRMLLAGVVALFAVEFVSKLISGAHYVDRPFVALAFTPLFPHAVNASFPSTLTAWIAVGAGASWAPARRLSIALLAGTAMVAFGCVFVGVHWVSDVLAGAALGIACGLGCWWLTCVPPLRAGLSRLEALKPRRL